MNKVIKYVFLLLNIFESYFLNNFFLNSIPLYKYIIIFKNIFIFLLDYFQILTILNKVPITWFLLQPLEFWPQNYQVNGVIDVYESLNMFLDVPVCIGRREK